MVVRYYFCRTTTTSTAILLYLASIFLPYYFSIPPRLNLPQILPTSLVLDGDTATIVRVILCGLWVVHFCKRMCEVVFVHIYSTKFPLVDTIGTPIYYYLISVFVGIMCSDLANYHPPSVPFVFAGGLVWLIGESVNGHYHRQLRVLRVNNIAGPPTGGLFNFVVCPHYFGEVLVWLGFSLASMSWAALVFWVVSTLTVGMKAHQRRAYYRHKYGDDRSIKRLVPFVF